MDTLTAERVAARARPGAARRIPAGTLPALAAAAALFCLPALLNGFPLVFPDTTAYLDDGQRLVRLDWPNNVRPVYYGLAIWFLHWERSAWPVVAVQGLVLAHLLWLTMRVAGGAPPRPAVFLGVATLLALLTPIGWYVSHLMPDIFAGVTILAIFLLGLCRDRLGAVETAYLVVLGTAATAFHMSHLAIALALAGTLLLARIAIPALRRRIRPGLAALPVVLAVAALLTSSQLLWGRLSLSPKSPPFLLARLVHDGPARAYLDETCAVRGWMLCRYRAEIEGMSEDDFLWKFLHEVHFRTLRSDGSSDATAIRAEIAPVVRGTLAAHPGQVAGAAARNALRQLLDIRAEIKLDPGATEFLRVQSPYAWDGLMRSAEGRRRLTQDAIAPMNRLHEVVAALGALACLPLAVAMARRRQVAALALLAAILAGMLANAAVAGGLSGVFGRYQGRIVWLVPFWALLALWLASLVSAPAETDADDPRPDAADDAAAGPGLRAGPGRA